MPPRRVRPKSHELAQVQDGIRAAVLALEFEVLLPFGVPTAIWRMPGTATLGQLVRSYGANVALPRVTPADSGRHVAVRNCSPGASLEVRPAGGGRINAIASPVSLASGAWGFFVVVPDGDNRWDGMYV